MEFETQRELLEYLGKNPNDRALVQRLIASWKVRKEDGVYYLVSKESLLEEVAELREKVLKLEAENESLKNNEWGDLMEKLKDAEVNVKYYKDLYEKESENNKEIIRNMYRYVTWTLHIKVEWEDFRNYAVGYEGQ